MNPNLKNMLLLETPAHYRFDQILAYLSRSPNECLFRVDDGTVTRCIPAGGERPIVTIGSEPDGRARIAITGVNPSRLPAIREIVTQYIADWFDWGTDLAPFFAMAHQDPLLCGPAERFYGLRLVGVPDLFETLCWAILGQQINLPFAYTLKRRFVEAFGDKVEDAGGQAYLIFPEPQVVASLATPDLAGLQMTTKKAEYLIGVAREITEGRLARDRLIAAGNVQEAERLLTGIRGIGPWTAHYVAMRNLRFPSAFPVQDVGLHLAIQKLLGSDRKPTIPEVRELSANWTNWEAYSTFYLWRTLY